jgi:uncharacterized membrane protein
MDQQIKSNSPQQDADGDDINSTRQRVMEEFETFERNFRTRMPLSWLASLLGPFVITAAILVALYFTSGIVLVNKVVAHAFLTFFVFGRLIILGGSEAQQVVLSPWELFLMVTYMDLMVALFVAFHMGIVFRIPFFGKIIAELVGDAQFLLKRNPWIQRVAFFGLVVFVIFPTSTTGSVGGSLFGRLLGLSRWTTVLAIGIGSVLGNGLMLLLSEKINQSQISDNLWIKITGILVIV